MILNLSRHSLARFAQYGMGQATAMSREGERISAEEGKLFLAAAKKLLGHMIHALEVCLPEKVAFHKFMKHGAKTTRYFHRKGLLYTIVRHQGEDTMVTVAKIPPQRQKVLLPSPIECAGIKYIEDAEKILLPYQLGKGERLEGGFSLRGGRAIPILFRTVKSPEEKPREVEGLDPELQVDQDFIEKAARALLEHPLAQNSHRREPARLLARWAAVNLATHLELYRLGTEDGAAMYRMEVKSWPHSSWGYRIEGGMFRFVIDPNSEEERVREICRKIAADLTQKGFPTITKGHS